MWSAHCSGLTALSEHPLAPVSCRFEGRRGSVDFISALRCGSLLKINQAESVEERKAHWTQRVFTGLWMPYWSSALRMRSLKSIKTPGMSESRHERRETARLWLRASVGTGSGVTHSQCLVIASHIKNNHTSDCENTRQLCHEKWATRKTLNMTITEEVSTEKKGSEW